MWKKAVRVAGALILVWWVGSNAVEWVAARGRMQPPSTFPVTGKVMFDNGTPLSGGAVTFYPKNPGAMSSKGKIDSNGMFKLSSFGEDDGARPGEYIVTIDPAGVEKAPLRIPRRYRQQATSPLKAEVREEDNTFEFRLTNSK
jgi:hypothetical protein